MSGRHLLRLLSVARPALCTIRTVSVASHKVAPTTIPQTAHKVLCATSFHSSRCRYNEHIINIQDEDDFKKRVLDNETPVVIDFHAEWCGPCKILGPRLEALIGDKAGKVILAKVDIDTNTDLAMNHGVQAVPTVLAMKGGKVVDKFVGVQDDTSIQSFINGLTGE